MASGRDRLWRWRPNRDSQTADGRPERAIDEGETMMTPSKDAEFEPQGSEAAAEPLTFAQTEDGDEN